MKRSGYNGRVWTCAFNTRISRSGPNYEEHLVFFAACTRTARSGFLEKTHLSKTPPELPPSIPLLGSAGISFWFLIFPHRREEGGWDREGESNSLNKSSARVLGLSEGVFIISWGKGGSGQGDLLGDGLVSGKE